ncbi:hypothetical protein [Burkholderia contaminans]|uniref:hypothetical protein n=1 Tax=Burkholderia contaminans TaxID=488447 RepID=UPI000F57F599|nr:hypothetical protein [Burkholderia contaminans]RQS90443.1 hypothetical protein DF035_35095 [Burkholderia contaminans]
MATKNQKVHGIIHTTSLACAGIGAGLAQVPGSDSAAIVPLQTAMIMGIGQLHGVAVTKSAAADLLLTFAATLAGRGISQAVVGWIPLWGNVVNAATAAAVTEAIGWAADQYFSSEDKPGAFGPA